MIILDLYLSYFSGFIIILNLYLVDLKLFWIWNLFIVIQKHLAFVI